MYNCILEVFALQDQQLIQGCSLPCASCPTAKLYPILGCGNGAEVGQDLLPFMPMTWKELLEIKEELRFLAQVGTVQVGLVIMIVDCHHLQDATTHVAQCMLTCPLEIIP